MIPLMKRTFLGEAAVKRDLAKFILSADRLSMGEQCQAFESAFAAFQGRKHALLFNSGGSANLALLQALKNLGVLEDGDLIGFSAITWSTNTMPVIQLGMRPLAIDCSTTTLNVMSGSLEKLLQSKNQRPKALFLTNVLGFTGDLPEIRKACKKARVILLEDNCESLGSELPEGRAGNFGLASTFSFFVAHHMSTIEGGMVCTDDASLAEMLHIVRANGWDRNLKECAQRRWRKKHGIKDELQAKYTFYDLGFNLRPTEITGFLGQKQLGLVEECIARREANYTQLDQAVNKNPELLGLDRTHMRVLSSFAFPVLPRTPQLTKKYTRRFTEAGVEIRPVIAGNIQRQPFYRKYVEVLEWLPNADFVHDCGFYFGNYPELTSKDLKVLSRLLSG